MVKWFTLAVLILGAACDRAGQAQETLRLEEIWRIGGFANPESVALSADGRSLYVSNVNGEGDAREGNGFISRVGLDGRLIELEWARDLDAPKGLALVGDELYVADIDQIVVLDAVSGEVERRIPATGALFLNDAAVTQDGLVVVADSMAGRIYAVRDSIAHVWLEDALLQSVNGLLPEPNRLVATTMQGRLLAIDFRTREITVLAEGLGDADGVAPLGEGRYLVSEWPGLMHVVDTRDGVHVAIMDTRSENRLLNDFLLAGDTLYQPHWEPSEITAYRVTR